MPNLNAPTEFGGKVQKNRVQPRITPDGKPGHEATSSEELMLVYTTGSEDNDPVAHPPDKNGEAFEGVLPLEEQIKLRREAGDIPETQTKKADAVFGQRRTDRPTPLTEEEALRYMGLID